MVANRRGTLVWNGAHIEWEYQTFKDAKTFEIKPHFRIKAIDPKNNEWVEWENVEVADDNLSDQIKGITDFTKLPKPLMVGILDNAVAKLYETEPDIQRITPHGIERL